MTKINARTVYVIAEDEDEDGMTDTVYHTPEKALAEVYAKIWRNLLEGVDDDASRLVRKEGRFGENAVAWLALVEELRDMDFFARLGRMVYGNDNRLSERSWGYAIKVAFFLQENAEEFSGLIAPRAKDLAVATGKPPPAESEAAAPAAATRALDMGEDNDGRDENEAHGHPD